MFQNIFNILVLVVYLLKSDLTIIPLTFYLPTWYTAQTSPANNYNYMSIKTCSAGIGTKNNQFELSILLQTNDVWDPDLGIILLQLSKCKDNFSQECVFATNYKWSDHPTANRTIIYNLDKVCDDINNCTIYIRTLAYSDVTTFTLEFTFTSNQNEIYQNWTTNYPFDGPTVINKIASPLSQYWRSNDYVTTQQEQKEYFSIAYCNQGTEITSIEIAITSPIGVDTTLVQQYVCPQTVGNYSDCTPATGDKYWKNDYSAPFNVLTCTQTPEKSLVNGVYLTVYARGPGDNGDGKNTYIVQVMINPNT